MQIQRIVKTRARVKYLFLGIKQHSDKGLRSIRLESKRYFSSTEMRQPLT